MPTWTAESKMTESWQGYLSGVTLDGKKYFTGPHQERNLHLAKGCDTHVETQDTLVEHKAYHLEKPYVAGTAVMSLVAGIKTKDLKHPAHITLGYFKTEAEANAFLGRLGGWPK